jgi:hypothetical protein
LRLILGLQRRLREPGASLRAKQALTYRHMFRDALTWLEIHGGSSELVEHWKSVAADAGPPEASAEGGGEPPPFRRRRRRRRRRRAGPTPGN